MPGRLCWPVHRVATGRRYTDSLTTIERHWTLEMVVDACETCDAMDAADAELAERK